MSERSARLNRYLFVGLLGVVGAGGAVMGLVGYRDFSAGLKRHDAVVASFPYSSTILVISIFLLMTAALSCLPAPDPARSGKARAQAPKWVGLVRMTWLVSAVVCIVGALLVRPIQHTFIGKIARDHGYVACPAITSRHDDDRWALPGPDSPTGRCPERSGHPIFSAR